MSCGQDTGGKGAETGGKGTEDEKGENQSVGEEGTQREKETGAGGLTEFHETVFEEGVRNKRFVK